MLRKIRLTLAVLFFLAVTLLFLDFTGTVHAWLGWTARIQFLPALLALNLGIVLALVALTLVFGRIYCSVVCPLRVLQDVIAWFGKKRKKNRYSYSPAKAWLRYGVLALFVIALVAGVGSFVALLARIVLTDALPEIFSLRYTNGAIIFWLIWQNGQTVMLSTKRKCG